MSIVKEKTAVREYDFPFTVGSTTYHNRTTQRDVERIVYDAGPRYLNGSCNWKRCDHTSSAPRVGGSIQFEGSSSSGWYHGWFVPRYGSFLDLGGSPINLSDSEWDDLTRSCCDEIQAKLDLNCQDRVMGYSAAIDLLPFIGAATRLSSTLNRAARKLMKRFGSTSVRRNIYEVIRLLISGDLINRFVIQTTIQDAHAVMNVFDRCLSTWETAYRRNNEVTVLSSSNSVITKEFSTTTNRLDYPPNFADAGAKADVHKYSECTATVQCRGQLVYKLSEADPIRWIAHALGIDTPLESIWDKIPFSFVVDYFTRVGEFFNEVGNRYGQDALRASIANISDMWLMTTCHSRTDWTARDPRCNRWMTIHLVGNKLSTTGYRTFRRVPILMRTSSGFWDKGGLFDVRLSSVRKRTLLELAIQIGGGKSK